MYLISIISTIVINTIYTVVFGDPSYSVDYYTMLIFIKGLGGNKRTLRKMFKAQRESTRQ